MDQYIPQPDILPVPGAPWLIIALGTFTFLIHVGFMNMLFGGTILALISALRGKKDSRHEHLAKRIFKFLPVVITFTINFGVPPLLFMQVLYGHLFYSSSILMATAWFCVIPLLILGYYGTYTLRFRWDKLGGGKLWLILFVTLIFSTIAFFFVNNLSLKLRPEVWLDHYFKNPSIGTLNLADPQLLARYLHMLLGALAVAGLWIMIMGARAKTGDKEWSGWAVGYGIRASLYATLINVLVGGWFLFVHPGRVIAVFLGGNIPATLTFALSVVLLVPFVMLLLKARKSQNPLPLAYWAAVMMAAEVALMIIMRQTLRTAYLAPHFSLDSLQVSTQWLPLIIFLLCFVFLLIPSLAWLLKVSIDGSGTAKD